MKMNKNLATQVGRLSLNTPLIPASGVWPMQMRFWDSPWLDACCTKGLTFEPKEGNAGVRIAETPSGVLNSIGLENPGLNVWVSDYLPQLLHSGKKIILNLAFSTLEELTQSLDTLNEVQEQITVLELNLSCPNVAHGGAAWGLCADNLELAVRKARSKWDGELWVKLTPQAHDFIEGARRAETCGADALVVANTWLGMAMDCNGKPLFQRIFAGLSGSAVFPLALRLVYQTAQSVGIPIVGCGGVASSRDVLDMLSAGASAVMIGSALLSNLNLFEELSRDLSGHIEAHSEGSISGWVGRAQKNGKNIIR